MEMFLKNIVHYYGDVVRKLFLLAAGILIVAAPFYPEIIPFNPVYVVLFILLVGILAGLTSPTLRAIIIIDTLFAALAFILFELSAFSKVFSYHNGTRALTFIFIVRQTLAFIFFFAMYYSAKTWRGTRV